MTDRLTIAAARPGMRVRWADNDAAPMTTIRHVWPDTVQVAGHVCAYHPQNFIPADPPAPALTPGLIEALREFHATFAGASVPRIDRTLLAAIEAAGILDKPAPSQPFHLTPQQFQEMHNAG